MELEQENVKFKILKLIECGQTDSIELSKLMNLDHQLIIGHLKSLETLGKVVMNNCEKKSYTILPDGKDLINNGSPENILMRYIFENTKNTKLRLEDIKGKLSDDVETRGFSNAMKLKLISVDKEGQISILKNDFNPKDDVVKNQLETIMNNPLEMNILDQNLISSLIKSKLIKLEIFKYFKIQKGPEFSFEIIKHETDLTTQLIAEDKYKTLKFKKFNFNSKGIEVSNGSLHPLMKVKTQFREIMLELGFEEMPTNNFVESSFWNFDSLFQPQQHPSRDAHDTFFLINPKYSEKLKDNHSDYINRVKEVHERGGYGSLGLRYNFSIEETYKNILRTHTTAVSSRMLYKLAKEFKETAIFTPKKYFSIDRVFRNESLDATHLCEFHQIEGLIVDYNLGLGHLIGVIEDFFHKFGVTKLRFKPAFNPYTEPSMEIFSFHEKLNKWVEIGNSGIFRPEMLAPMGLPNNVRVIAWGLSLERPTMIHYKYDSIKDLFGEEVKLKETKNSKIYCINCN